ncbi:AraC family transcriptional regulator [Nocardioides sp. LHD-245]|uniref:AraC family transcriptional regulator n=1 Tax=Nocardioides sp. LHD-245 TaxID=3051387 RepID=UPI0027E16983|nr:AraC family transcriptional regulator [Nocardioides sp. LHD-245]
MHQIVEAQATAPDHEPLHQYGRLRTSDPDEAQHVVADVYEPHVLTPDRSTTLRARMNAVQSGELTIGYLTYGLAAGIDLPPNDSWYHINVTLRGDSTVTRSDGSTTATTGRRSAAVLLPHHRQAIAWNADTEQLAVRIPREALEAQVATLLQRPVDGPLELGLNVDLTTPAGRGLLRALDFVVSEWDADGLMAHNALARRQLESLVLSSLVLASTGPHQSVLEEESTSRPEVVRAVCEHIDARAADLPTLADLVAVAGVGARTLQSQFRATMGCTPIQYLRQERLRRVRAELDAPRSATATVTDVATRWGFYHLGRFSSTYRATFGELPSQTLERGLRGHVPGRPVDDDRPPRDVALLSPAPAPGA